MTADGTHAHNPATARQRPVSAHPPAPVHGSAAERTLDHAVALDVPAEFAARYDAHYPAVYRYCYLRLGQREAAEDASSETFLRALRALPDYRGGVFAGWLLRIARNVCADHWRQYYRQPRSESLDAAADERAFEAPDQAASPEEQALAAEAVTTLRTALAHLTPPQRDLLELQLAGLTTAEIADAMQRSTGAVRILRLRAQLHLRRILVLPTTEATGARAATSPPNQNQNQNTGAH